MKYRNGPPKRYTAVLRRNDQNSGRSGQRELETPPERLERLGGQVGLHAYAILYLWAYDLSAAGAKKQRKWLIDYARNEQGS